MTYGTHGANGRNGTSPYLDDTHSPDITVAHEIMKDKDNAISDDNTGKAAGYGTNQCLTVYMPFLDANSTTARGGIAGFNFSVQDCMDHAVDGFTQWGTPFIWKAGF